MINTVVVEGFANRAKFGAFDDGTQWCNFTLRHSSYAGKDDAGDAKYNASFIDVKARRYPAENAHGVIPEMTSEERAVRVIVTGQLRQETWGEEGAKRSSTFLLADSITITEAMRPSVSAGASSNGGGKVSYSSQEPF